MFGTTAGARNEMKVRAEFYSRLKDIAGAPSQELELAETANVGAFFEELCRRHPRLRDFEKSILFGIGVEFVGRPHQLQEGDAVAVMPPVQGG